MTSSIKINCLRMVPIAAVVLLLVAGVRLANSQINSTDTVDLVQPRQVDEGLIDESQVDKSINADDVTARPEKEEIPKSENSASDHIESNLLKAKSESAVSEDNTNLENESSPKDNASSTDGSGSKNEESVWADISSAIISLNSAVGAEMFLELKRAQKGQMEVRLDKGYWDRVQYQTRVSLKSDISDLWHLYSKKYKFAESSVVYFIDHQTDKVIDIFSRAK